MIIFNTKTPNFQNRYGNIFKYRSQALNKTEITENRIENRTTC